MFSSGPSSVQVAQAGTASADGFEIMSYHERRLTHDFILLRSEQQKTALALAKLKIDLNPVMGATANACMGTESQEVHGELQQMQARFAALQAACDIEASFGVHDKGFAEPLADNELLGKLQHVEASCGVRDSGQTLSKFEQALAEELLSQFEQMEARLKSMQVDVELPASLSTSEIVLQDSSGPGRPQADVLDEAAGPGNLGKELDAKFIEMQRWRARVDNDMQNWFNWRAQVDKHIEDVLRKLEKMNVNIREVARKTIRTALYAADMKPEERKKTLGVFEQECKQSSSKGNQQKGGVSPRTEVMNTIRGVNNIGGSSSLPSGPEIGPESGNTTPRSSTTPIPDEMPPEARGKLLHKK